MNGTKVMSHGGRIHFDHFIIRGDVMLFDYFYVRMLALDFEIMFPFDGADHGKIFGGKSVIP